jgi:hypothetical protein
MNTDSVLSVVFFLTDSGGEPVREWLKSLDKEDRKAIGEDIKLVVKWLCCTASLRSLAKHPSKIWNWPADERIYG